jgi:hypothetical protein
MESIFHILLGLGFYGYKCMLIASKKGIIWFSLIRILSIEFIPIFSFKTLESIEIFKKSSQIFDRKKI